MTQTAIACSGIAEMLRAFSVELNPGDAKVIEAACSRLDPGTEVFFTWIPGTDPMPTVEAAARLRRSGLTPVPHIGARHVESAAQLQRVVEGLAEAGVDRVLIVGGDRAHPAGPYDSSLAVMQTEILQKAGIHRIAVAGFPEGNPHIAPDVLEEALAAKVDFARRAGLQLSIVTQFCFAAKPIVDWLKRIRAQGLDQPVRIGLAGPAGLLTLARYAVRCGIGNSLHVLTENPTFAKLLTEKGPEPIIRGIADLTGPTSPPSLPQGVAGLHFFVFGGFNKTMDWISSQRPQSQASAHT